MNTNSKLAGLLTLALSLCAACGVEVAPYNGFGGAPPVCTPDALCDDGDPCTVDLCTFDGCKHELATHDVECPSSNGIGHGYCAPLTGQCCVGYDVPCCYGCIFTESIDGSTMDVCLDKCPGSLSCDPTDGRCH